jgi:hypothetical protein
MATKPGISNVIWLTAVGAFCAIVIMYLTLNWMDHREARVRARLPMRDANQHMFGDADSRARLREDMGKKPH